MAERNIEELYQTWCEKATEDIDLGKELKAMKEEEKEDAFYRELEFGTGGLRGTIGAGTNRMNVYTVAKASQGLANYIKAHYVPERRSIAISRDSRLKSDTFAKTAARVFAANGIHVYIYPYISPVPTLSFATRYLRCASGVMITASHNPSKYNGYKVYGEDGCQITTEAADEILKDIEALDIFNDVKKISYDEGFKENLIEYIKPEVITAFLKEVKKQSMLTEKDQVDKNVAIVYSPLNGTGLVPVTRILEESGYTNITIVKEQQFPNGYFPTCPYPNPEIKEAMALGMEYAKKNNADLLLATDPDCDRVGIAVKNKEGEYQLLTGNETGMLLFDYLCSRRVANHTMPLHPVMVKTIVTIDMAERIAEHYGVKTVNVLTGFKYIGDQIGLLEKEGRVNDYIFGFEESYGVLSGTYVRDKDAVDGAFLICEMFAYYKTKGISLLDKLSELYQEYGYTRNTLHSYEFDGPSGALTMKRLMERFHGELGKTIVSFGGLKIEKILDYSKGLDGLPKSDVIKCLLENHCSLVIRPSGTEPKLKLYVSVTAKDKEEASDVEKEIVSEFESLMK